ARIGQRGVGLGVGHRGGRRRGGRRRRGTARVRPGRGPEGGSTTGRTRRLAAGRRGHRREPVVVPRGGVVRLLRLVVAGEQAVVELVARGHDEAGVGVQLHVVLVVQLVLEDVVD